MNPIFHRGYTVYRNNDGPVFVAIHAGPDFETPTNRDENTDMVSSLCWKKMGGALAVCNLSRKRSMGIDLNRDIPPKRLAIGMWEEFVEGRNADKTAEYRAKYAWAAKNVNDYNERLKIYNDFWANLKNLGNLFVFMHRKYARLKNYPSIMDIVTFKGKGIDEKVVRQSVESINTKYAGFFRKIEQDYVSTVMLEQSRIFDRIEYLFGGMNELERSYMSNIKADIKVIKEFATPSMVKRLEAEFTKENFLDAARNAMRHMGKPRITIENIFSGELAYGPRNQLVLGKNKFAIEIECNQFINYWYPDVVSNMICEFLVDAMQKLGKTGEVQLDIYDSMRRKMTSKKLYEEVTGQENAI